MMQLLSLVLALAPLGGLACNTQAEIDAMPKSFHDGRNGMDSLPLKDAVAVTLLPQDAGDESPACLDGSPYGFYFVPSKTNSTKWTISISGGGWCYDEDLCLARASTSLGSSTQFPATAGCGCMNVKDGAQADDEDPIDHDCNCLYMPYGDGASFSGFRAKPWPVPSTQGKQSLYFRGIKNFDATVSAALELGLGDATDFVLTGGSAGGLSTFLHMDRIANRLKAAGSTATVRGAPVVGFFLDHDNLAHSDTNYTAWMKYIYNMQNLTFGGDGGLTKTCETLFPSNPHYCFMAPHVQSVVQTHFFVFNSRFDAWQLQNELQSDWKTPATKQAVVDYGEDFLVQFAAVELEKKNGAFITSCICHGCPWATLSLDGKTSYQHYSAWTVGNATGSDAFHLDMRGPNGDGTIVDPKCAVFA